MQKKQKILLTIVILLMIITLVASYLFYARKTNKDKNENIAEKPQVVVDESQARVVEEKANDEQKTITEIIKSNDFGKCQNLKDKTNQTICANNIALNLAFEKKDISYCQKLDNELVPINDCERRLAFQISLEKESDEICQQLSSEELTRQCQENFLANLALKKNDNSVCQRYDDENKKTACVNEFTFQLMVNGNIETINCDNFIGEDLQKDCYSLKQKAADIAMDCSQFNSVKFVQYCMQNNGMNFLNK